MKIQRLLLALLALLSASVCSPAAAKSCAWEWFYLYCKNVSTLVPYSFPAYTTFSLPFDAVGLGFTTGLIVYGPDVPDTYVGALTHKCKPHDDQCIRDRLAQLEPAILSFEYENILRLSEEAAQGGGNHLASLARLYGMQGPDAAAFADLCRKKYATLFDPKISTPEEFRNRLEDAMRADKTLVWYLG